MYAKRMIQLTLIVVLLVTAFAVTQGVSASGNCSSTYVVRPGDWLSKIAGRCGVTLSQLYTANPWVGFYIYPGQVLNIPGGTHIGGHFFCGPTYSEYYGNYYVVCRGDTLSGIARYYGETLGYMQWHNNIPNANRIYAGQFIWP